MKAFPYQILMQWSRDDEGFVARVPALPGCVAFGETPEEAGREILSVAEMWLESLAEDGDEIPPSDLREPVDFPIRGALATASV